MSTITVSDEEFKTIHNALCDLRSVEQRLNDVISESMATKLAKIIERSPSALLTFLEARQFRQAMT
jgi:hypothetical protein